MLQIIETTARKWHKCAACDEQIRPGEDVVAVEKDGQQIKGSVYCSSHSVLEFVVPSYPNAIFKMPGDNRWFAMTANGPRAGTEHTGIRCEDAPCCGCCN